MAEIPNIRRQFLPDPGYILVDADQQGADAQIVAWEANDLGMKASLRAGISLHNQTATRFWEDKFATAVGDNKNKRTPKGKMYDDIKRATHGTNYGASANTIAANLGWTVAEATRFKRFWLHVEHPGIGAWHSRTERLLRTEGIARNAFEFEVRYYDRVDGLLPEALAWVPQSTVAIASFMGAIKIKKAFPYARFSIQVHDSIVFQIPKNKINDLEAMLNLLLIEVPYPDPLIMPSKIAVSSVSWGDVAVLTTEQIRSGKW